MSETLLEQVNRIEIESRIIKKIQSIKPPKPIDYSMKVFQYSKVCE